MPRRSKKPGTSERAEALRELAVRPYAGGRTAQRVAIVRQLIGRGWSSGRIRERLAAEWKIHPRTVVSYIQAVTESRRLEFEAAMKDNTLIGEILTQIDSHYEECIKKGALSAAGKDLERKMALGGLGVQRVELSGPAGAPIETVQATKIVLDGLSEEEFIAMGRALGLHKDQ